MDEHVAIKDVLPVVALSLLVHIAIVACLFGYTTWTERAAKSSQTVLITKLVQLGKTRPKELLPRVQQPTKEVDTPVMRPEAAAPVASAVPIAAVASAKTAKTPPKINARTRVASMNKISDTLQRLKEKMDGAADGSVDGDTSDPNLAVKGQVYVTKILRCLQKNYVIEGMNPAKVANLSVLMLVRIRHDGAWIDSKIQKKSGVAAFDQAVHRAAAQCNHLEAPPKELQRQLQRDGMLIEFKP